MIHRNLTAVLIAVAPVSASASAPGLIENVARACHTADGCATPQLLTPRLQDPPSVRFVTEFKIHSARLDDVRRVTVFLPPRYRPRRKLPMLFCADGQAVEGFAERLQREMKARAIPETVVVGVHSREAFRAKEYIPENNEVRFAAHERFFTDELFRWIASELLGVPLQRNLCGVFGFSNGAIFAVAMGHRHRERYGVAVAFSVPGKTSRFADVDWTVAPQPRVYLSAGEPDQPLYECSCGYVVKRHN